MLDMEQIKAYADTIPDDCPCKSELILAYLSAGMEQLKTDLDEASNESR